MNSDESLEKLKEALSEKFSEISGNKEELNDFITHNIDEEFLEKIRKIFSRAESQKKGMAKKASSGSLVSRIPFGYRIEGGNLVPAENFREVEEIFEEFLNSKISLTQLAKKHNFSVNGLKKILRNYTYIGKVKFDNQIYDGTHKPIISSTLFNRVQDKLDKIGLK